MNQYVIVAFDDSGRETLVYEEDGRTPFFGTYTAALPIVDDMTSFYPDLEYTIHPVGPPVVANLPAPNPEAAARFFPGMIGGYAGVGDEIQYHYLPGSVDDL